MKKLFLAFVGLSVSLLNAAVVWENSTPADLAMFNCSGVTGAPVIEDGALTFSTKKGGAVFIRKNVDFSADNDNIAITLKAPAGSRSVNCYFITDSDKKYAENKRVTIYYRATGNWQTVKFNCSKNANWKGQIKGFRLDFYAPAGQKVQWKQTAFSGKDDLPKAWNFDADGAAAWDWKNAAIANGAMKVEISRKYTMSPTIPVYMDSAKYATLTIKAKASIPGNYGAVIYFKTTENGKLNEKQKISFRLKMTGEYQEFRIPLNRYSSWKGIITGFRLDISSPKTPCVIEFRDIVFAADDNLAGLKTSGKEFGPFRYFKPEGNYSISFLSPAPGKGELRIEDAFGKNVLNTPLQFTAGICHQKFQVPGNGATVFISFEKPVRNLTILAEKQKAAANWTASWIADELNFKLKGHQFFQKEVFLTDNPLDCRFQATADDRMDLYINGKKVILPERVWQKPRTADITRFFKKGKNLIAFHLENNGEASGLLANFAILTADGNLINVDTDASFRTLRNPGKDWTTRLYAESESFAPKVIGPYDTPPWGNWCLMPFEIFARRNQFTAKESKLTPIKGGVRLETTLTADMVSAPQNKISAMAVVENTVIAKENIVFEKPLNNGESIRIETDLFAGKLLKDNYELQLSGFDTHTNTVDNMNFTVSENPEIKKNISSEIRQLPHGPVIFINGEPFNEMIFYSAIIDRMQEHYDAGYRFFMIGTGTNVGKGLTTPGWNEHGYDFTTAQRNLNRITAAFPDIKLILSFGIDAPYWWHRKYPDQSIYLEGKSQHENLASPASMQWRKDGAEFIKAFITHFENSPLRSNIVGYRLSSLCDGGEWQYPGVWASPQRHADFSAAMRDYFRDFLKRKYGKNFDSSKINVPSGKDRQLSGSTWFRDPEKEQLVIDYIECQSDAVATAATGFLKAAKSVSNGKIVGIYGGYVLFYSGYPVQNIGHLAFNKIYQAKVADFFSGPIDYHLRKLGLPGGNMASVSSLKLHGATYFQENDTRTFLNRSPSHRHVDNLYESVSVLMRDSAIGLVTHTPIYTCDLTGNSYRNQGLIEAGKLLNKSFKTNFNPKQVVKPDVALLYSIESLPYLIEKNGPLTNASSYLLRINTGKSGAQTDAYWLKDILMDNFPVDQYKCFVIVNGFYLRPEIRQAIEQKLCKNGATVVFTPGAGIIKDRKLSPESMKEITGFDFEKINGKIPYQPVNMKQAPYLVRNFKDHRRIYLSSTELTPELYRHIFSNAGAHIWLKSNDPIGTNGATCFIHAATSGKKIVILPFAAEVTDLISGQKIPTMDNGRRFAVTLRKYETRLYKFDRK